MKKQLLSIAVVFTSIIGAKAQAPDMGFETWTLVPQSTTIYDPTGWASFNVLTYPLIGMAQSVFQQTVAPYAGNISAKIVTEKIPSIIAVPNPFDPGNNMDTAGVLLIGKVVGTSLSQGYTYVNRPATLSFAWKYTPNNSLPGVPDTAYVMAQMTHWNGTSRDIVAQGMFKTHFSTTSYSTQTINMNYDPAFANVMPDSQQIQISSSIFIGDGAKYHSAFYVDDFQWAGYVSVGEINGQNAQVSIFPNPASSNVNFKSNVDVEKINILDITGRIVGTYDMIDNKVSISTENYSSGIYFYNLLNSKKEIISRDKFEVVK